MAWVVNAKTTTTSAALPAFDLVESILKISEKRENLGVADAEPNIRCRPLSSEFEF